MSAFGPPVDGLRTIRLVLVLVACGVVMNTAGVVVSFFLNSDRVDQINQERAQNVKRNCEDVNSRHDGALTTLDEILEARERTATPGERERLRGSRETTALLIDALVPKRDCAALVRQQVNTNP